MASRDSRKSFLLRTDPKILDALGKWAKDEMRSINGQIEYLLRRALIDAARLKSEPDESDNDESETDEDEE